MVFRRRKKKWAALSGLPTYDSKSKELTIVLHVGGTFTNNSEYVGGQTLHLDWCTADKISISVLKSFAVEVGVLGNLRFHLKLKDGSLKLILDDDDLRKWATEIFLNIREMYVYWEELVDDEDEQDINFIVPDDNTLLEDCLLDDILFDEVVENIEEDYDEIDASNIIIEGAESEMQMRAPVGNHAEADDEGELPARGDSDYDSFDDLDYSIGNEVTDDEDENIYEEEVERVQGEFEHVDPRNIIPEGQNNEVQESEEDSGSEEDAVDATEHFDEGRVSDEDFEDADQGPSFNPEEKYRPEFVLKQVFATKKIFKFAVQSHAINNRRNIKFMRNDNRRVYAKCLDSECKWMITALRMKNDTSFQVRKLLDNHTCAPSHKVKSMTSSWLSERFLQRFQSDSGRSVRGFMIDDMHDTRVEISKTQAYKAKKQALAKIEGDPDAQYAKLWSYADELRKRNPGSTILVGTEVNNDITSFSSFYCCFSALRVGFLTGCRKILGIDGCFLKGKYGGVLLTAVGVDANNNPFSVAYAVVEKESQDWWEWFLHILKQDLQIDASEFTFISDKQTGLIGAMEAIFPGVCHRFCVRHLLNNLRAAGFRGLDYKNAMLKAANSTTEGAFKAAMDEMKVLSAGAWEWFQNKPPHQWSKAYFTENSKCDMLLNNVCETFNANILEARDKSIITMLEWIRESLMVRLQKNRDRALSKWKGVLCPKIQKILDRNIERVVDCLALKASDTAYQVSSFDNRQFTVDLKNQECSCRAWQLTKIPCTHAIISLLRQSLDPVDFVDACYHVQTYNLTYELPIYGISYDLLWGESLYIPPLPPNFGIRAKRGRKPMQRRKGAFEKDDKKNKNKLQKMKRQTLGYRCKKCGVEGHNSITCGRKKQKTTPTVTREKSNERAETSKTKQGSSSEVNHIAPPKKSTNQPQGSEVNDSGMGVETQGSQISFQAPVVAPVVGPTVHQQMQLTKRTQNKN